MADEVAAHDLCDLCSRARSRLLTDHDHSTGRIRGRICYRCNFLLGILSDDPSLFERVTEYLDRPQQGTYVDYKRMHHNSWSKTAVQRQKRSAYARRRLIALKFKYGLQAWMMR